MKISDLTPVIYVMVGLPGSGKSTWIKNKLASDSTAYVIVSSDDEIERLAAQDGLSYNDGFDKYVGQATSIMKQKFREAVNNNENIIWDQTNMTPKKRRTILQQVPATYRKVAIVFELDDNELNNRLNKRSRETGKTIPAHVIKSMAQSYIPPAKSEGFDEIRFV